MNRRKSDRFLSGGSTSQGRLERALRLTVPLILLGIFFLAGLAILPLPVVGEIKPAFVLMTVYYWAIYRPTLVPPFLCFGLGLLMDILGGLPLGMNALVLVAVRWTVSDQRRFLTGQPFIAIWAVFGLVDLGASLAQWGLFGLAHMHWTPLLPVATAALASFFLFPAVTLLLIFAHRVLPVASRTIP